MDRKWGKPLFGLLTTAEDHEASTAVPEMLHYMDPNNLPPSLEEYNQEKLSSLIDVEVEVTKAFEWFPKVAHKQNWVFADNDFQITGSVTEGAILARCVQSTPLLREIEMDFMFNISTLPEDVRDVIESVAGKPGFVRLPYDALFEKYFRPKIPQHHQVPATDDNPFTPTPYISPLVMRKYIVDLVTLQDSVYTGLPNLFNNLKIQVSTESTATTAATTAKVFSTDGSEFYGDVSIDFVPALRSLFWPQQATSWIIRSRRFPPPETVQNIVDKGCHLVPRSSQEGDIDTEWRLSFSTPEATLAHLRSPEQQRAYYFFKMLFYRYLKGVETAEAGKKNLFSYVMKTTMLWACEEYPADEPVWSTLEQSVGMLLSRLMDSLQSGCVPHYFIPEINLIEMTGTDVKEKAIRFIGDLQSNNIFMRALYALDIEKLVELAFACYPVALQFSECMHVFLMIEKEIPFVFEMIVSKVPLGALF